MRLLLVFLAVAAVRRPADRPPNRSLLAYVGTYSSPQGPEGSRGNGQGIYLFPVDPSTGSLSQREVTLNGSNPSCLALDPSKTHLYSANETATFEGANSGSVSAYSIDRSTGHLTLLNTVSSQGAGPAHLSVHPSGKYVLVANYHGGTVAVLPIRPDGSLGAASDVKKDEGDIVPSAGRQRACRQLCLQRPRPAPCPHDPGRSLRQVCAFHATWAWIVFSFGNSTPKRAP